MMTDLEIFDFVAAHLLRQGRRSMNGHGTCVFRGRRGASCAVGCLIKDEFYTPELDGDVYATRAAVAASLGQELTRSTGRVLVALAHIHDAAQRPADWPVALPALRRDLFPDEPIPA